ncbi:MAG: hypothetical protein JNK05_11110 [Myxococcales bacterium]|nr:hypothetical protein [Myxococcales bacterium]
MSENATAFPVGQSIFSRVKKGLHALHVLKDDPGNELYGPLFNAQLDAEAYTALVREFRQNAEGRAMLDTRPTLQGPDLDLAALGALPEGTLGREFARYFEDNKIAPFVSSFAIDSDEAFLSKRYRETHDLFHVLTGYKTHMLGEMELQAFVFGNLRLPSTAFIVFFSTVYRLKSFGGRELRAYVARLHGAYSRGRRSRMLMTVPFETMWERPLREVSEALLAPAMDTLPEVTVGVHQHEQFAPAA